MPLPDGHLENVCRFGEGEKCCAFLAMGASFLCTKGTNIEPAIRSRLAAGTMNAKGDNCSGPPNYEETPDVE